jgi:hypothetical protein
MHLITIGNSKGIRIAKSIIIKYGFDKGLDLIEEKNGIKLVPSKNTVRSGWGDFYKKNHLRLDSDIEFLECGIDDQI